MMESIILTRVIWISCCGSYRLIPKVKQSDKLPE